MALPFSWLQKNCLKDINYTAQCYYRAWTLIQIVRLSFGPHSCLSSITLTLPRAQTDRTTFIPHILPHDAHLDETQATIISCCAVPLVYNNTYGSRILHLSCLSRTGFHARREMQKRKKSINMYRPTPWQNSS